MIGLAMFLAMGAEASIPTGREAYIGCYLVVQGNDVPLAKGPAPDPYSAASCLMLVAIGAEREASKPLAQRNFCIPSIIAANPYRDMAMAYVKYYEAAGGRLAEASSIDVARNAFASQWPCR